MSMVTLTILQAIGVFATYLFTTIVLPALVFHKRLHHRRLSERVIFYYLFGNTYVINLVLLLGLLKILNRWTLLLFTALPCYIFATYVNHVTPQGVIKEISVRFRRLFTGIFGIKNAIYRMRISIVDFLKKWVPKIWKRLSGSPFEWILMGILAVAVIWMFGTQLVTQLGYVASDLPVHNMWVNYMSPHDGKPGIPFGAGVYPFGFHCIVYFLHKMYGFDTYVIFRVFYIGQDFMIFLMLALFIKLSSKTRYLGYAAAIALLVFKGLRFYSLYFRLVNSLPQENGMIFILPGIYFLFQFFAERKREIQKKEEEFKIQKASDLAVRRKELMDPEVKRQMELRKIRNPIDKKTRRKTLRKEKKRREREEKRRRKEDRSLGTWGEWRRKRRMTRMSFTEMKNSWYCLCGLGMSFSLTLSIHFYDTMIAGLYVAAVGVAFAVWIFRRYYFWSLLMTGILSIVVAVTPMAIAVIGGTPLQGSLGWGMSILSGKDVQVSGEDTETEEFETETVTETGTESSGEAVTESGEQTGTEAVHKEGVWEWDTELATEVMYKGGKKVIKPLSLSQRLHKGIDGIIFGMKTFVFSEETGEVGILVVFFSVGALLGVGILFVLMRKWFYGCRLIATAIYTILMMVLMAAKDFGVPALMAQDRAGIFMCYTLVIPIAFLLDGICYFIRLIIRRKRSMQILSLIMSAAILICGTAAGGLRGPVTEPAKETNSAITCITNIIAHNKDYTYTVISASDERNMMFDHAYHTELITLLRKMEFYSAEKKFTIPSQKIYVFVERIPVEFGAKELGLVCERKGQMINRKDANRMLDFNAGNLAYCGDTRWTTMARAYYWAENFREMYPDEVSVYYETDDFVCFEIVQNPYRSFNLAIDYGYNSVDWNRVRPEDW